MPGRTITALQSFIWLHHARHAATVEYWRWLPPTLDPGDAPITGSLQQPIGGGGGNGGGHGGGRNGGDQGVGVLKLQSAGVCGRPGFQIFRFFPFWVSKLALNLI